MKHYFSPIPNRALFDEQMTGRKLKILGVIAAHDRMGGNGQHCTLSVRRIGDKLGIHFQHVAQDIRDLVECGYLLRLPHPKHKQRQQLAVVYDDAADLASVKGDRNRVELRSVPETVTAEGYTEYINPKVDKRYTPEGASPSQSEAAAMQGSGLDSEEGPCFEVPTLTSAEDMDRFGLELTKEENDGAFLRKLESAALDGYRYSPEITDLLYERLTSIHDAYENGDALGGWAYRILQEVELELAG